MSKSRTLVTLAIPCWVLLLSSTLREQISLGRRPVGRDLWGRLRLVSDKGTGPDRQ